MNIDASETHTYMFDLDNIQDNDYHRVYSLGRRVERSPFESYFSRRHRRHKEFSSEFV